VFFVFHTVVIPLKEARFLFILFPPIIISPCWRAGDERIIRVRAVSGSVVAGR
jgi:hypothetical protein